MFLRREFPFLLRDFNYFFAISRFNTHGPIYSLAHEQGPFYKSVRKHLPCHTDEYTSNNPANASLTNGLMSSACFTCGCTMLVYNLGGECTGKVRHAHFYKRVHKQRRLCKLVQKQCPFDNWVHKTCPLNIWVQKHCPFFKIYKHCLAVSALHRGAQAMLGYNLKAE